jgi:hypothetical protein
MARSRAMASVSKGEGGHLGVRANNGAASCFETPTFGGLLSMRPSNR